ncbi:MAG: phospholipase D-like domain-containing protein [Acidobacteriota bacterium]|nr:phospholipase D-like domain-containing protein [Acidobacteriota bacterium]
MIVQPGDGIAPLVKAINSAKTSVEVMIFRFDRGEIAKALADAVARGVGVHALIAFTNRGGEKNLRTLEMQLLAAGVTVSRTADDLARYHGKMMIIDRRDLYVLAFNFTLLDIERSRSFGIVTSNPKLVQEAVKLFEADTKRQPYSAGSPQFVVSPVNARKQLSAFIKGARKQLLIYDPEVSDAAVVRLLAERCKAGVDIRIIGRLSGIRVQLAVRKLGPMRLHTRTIIRDAHQAFVGSQSLRELELGARREIGIIFRDPKTVNRLVKTFEEDWEASGNSKGADATEDASPADKVAKRVAKAVAKGMPPLGPVLDGIVKKVVGEETGLELNALEMEATVKEAVKEAVKEVVRDAVENIEQPAEPAAP